MPEPLPLPACPFPGMRPFSRAEADLFFGRSDETHSLLRTLRRSRLVTVVGNSGTGKSSIVRAGVLPPLSEGFMVSEPGLWRFAVMRPGRADHVARLAAALCGEDRWHEADALGEVTDRLRTSGRGLADVARAVPARSGSRFLLLVDQFEEIFGFLDRPEDFAASDEATAFVRLLLEAASQRDIPIYVILTMRAEFLGHCAAIPLLQEAIGRALFLLPVLGRAQLRRAIEGPLDLSGVRIEPGVTTRLLNDAGRVSDRLPLLAHALMGTWRAWVERASASADSDGRLPRIEAQDYELIGGLEGALDTHLDSLYHELTPPHRGLAEQMFRSLATTLPDGTRVRSPTTLARLKEASGVSADELRGVIEHFSGPAVDDPSPGRGFITVSSIGGRWEDGQVDLVHEAVFRRWRRYDGWMESEAADQAEGATLVEEARSWWEGNRPAELLFTGYRLERATQWRHLPASRGWLREWPRIEGDLPMVDAFLDASRQLAGHARQRRVRVGVALFISTVVVTAIVTLALT